ncbi:MAG TPA: inner membrane CreD family protein, partial [Terriglobales bacterium]|nr:inner membrane CreD family protein [Terriglobales bacterium]
MSDTSHPTPEGDPDLTAMAYQPSRPLFSGNAFRRRRGSGFEAAKRLIFLTILVLLMLIPLNMVEGVVQERAERKLEVETEIGAQWGPAQTVGGPILVIPYDVTETRSKSDGSNENRLVRHYASFL